MGQSQPMPLQSQPMPPQSQPMPQQSQPIPHQSQPMPQQSQPIPQIQKQSQGQSKEDGFCISEDLLATVAAVSKRPVWKPGTEGESEDGPFISDPNSKIPP